MMNPKYINIIHNSQTNWLLPNLIFRVEKFQSTKFK